MTKKVKDKKIARICCGQCEYFLNQFPDDTCDRCYETKTMIGFKLSDDLKSKGYKVKKSDYIRLYKRIIKQFFKKEDK